MAATAPAAAGRPQGCTHLKLRQLGRLVARHYEAHVAPTGLKNMQYSLLSHVVKLGPLHMGALAAAMKVDASTLSRNLAPLVARRLVEVGAGSDQRSRLVGATLAGQALREEAQQAWKRAQLALNRRLGEARVAALHAALEEAMALLEAPVETETALCTPSLGAPARPAERTARAVPMAPAARPARPTNGAST
ncbi:MAG: winged helix-turn-helix transcriptional regulator [Rubrivivax sp.]|nr:winged helix-turn-helix transcriptional regulator [Rubrivivax sp.]